MRLGPDQHLQPHAAYAAGTAALWAFFVIALILAYIALRIETSVQVSLSTVVLNLGADAVIAVGLGYWLSRRAARWADSSASLHQVIRWLALWSGGLLLGMSAAMTLAAVAGAEGSWREAAVRHLTGRWPGVLLDYAFLWAIAVTVVPVAYLKRQPKPGQTEQANAGAAATADRLVVRNGNGEVLVPISSIIAVTSAQNYVELRLASSSLLHRATMAQMEKMLGPPQFIRVHRSAIVRVSEIASLGRPKINSLVLTLSNGLAVSVGRNYRSVIAAAVAKTSRHTG